MTQTRFNVLNAAETASRLPFDLLCQTLATTAADYFAGQIHSPERQVLPLAEGGLLLSMPATANDIGIHKLVNVCPANRQRGLNTIHGMVSIYAADSGVPLLMLDGPTVTARRTAAVSMLAIRSLSAEPPRHVAIIGSGKQASGHLQALAELYPGIRVDVHGLQQADCAAFCRQHADLPLDMHPLAGSPVDDAASVVITVTTSRKPVYDQAARADRLLIGVGAFTPEMAELAPSVIHGSQLFVDDPAGGRHEAGDLIQADVDWTQVASLSDAVAGRFDPSRPRLFKSVGCAAWDLAAARCALQQMQAHGQA